MDAEAAIPQRRAGVPAAGAHREAAVADEGLVEPPVGRGADHLRQQFEGLGLAGLGRRVGGDDLAEAEARLAHPGIGEANGFAGLADGGRRAAARADGRIGVGLAVGFLGEAEDGFRRHVAGDDEDGVVRRVMAPVEGHGVVEVELPDLRLEADDRDAVGMVLAPEAGLHALAETGARVVVDALAPLLQHHVALGQDDGIGEDEAGHAVGLEVHHGRQLVRDDALEIAGVVIGGEGVLLAAGRRHGAREDRSGIALRALEHQVLEEMGEARLALLLVGRADPVPQHVGDHGDPMVGNGDGLQSIGEDMAIGAFHGDARKGRRRQDGRRGERGEAECEHAARQLHRRSSSWVGSASRHGSQLAAI